ncbi:MAG: preprotein translocase subunit SecE [Muribaculaceae bacterium]|nr:preprotein translocase subunit SecE [Muribaculaceae bacterium]
MKKFFYNRLTDIKESYNELVHKVSWPTKSELANSTIVVMVASIIASLVIWLIDLCIDKIMHLVYGVVAA